MGNDIDNKNKNVSEEQNVAAMNTNPEVKSNIELPDIIVPKKEHIPTPEEIEAEKKKEEAKLAAEKAQKRAKYFNSEDKILISLEEEKESNPLIPLFFFIILLVFIPLLPVVSGIFNKLNTFKPFEEKPPAQVVEQEEKRHKFKDSQNKVKLESLDLTNFVKSYNNQDYEIHFTVINNGEEAFDFTKKYYMILYDEEQIVYRALIHSFTPLAAKSAQEMSLIINRKAYDNADSFTLEEINETQYPDINITATSGDYKLLTCKYRFNTMEYFFENDTLMKIKETYQEEKEQSLNFDSNKLQFYNLSSQYRKITGIESTFIETATDFTMINELDLKNIQDKSLSELKVYRYFKFREKDKNIAFEMQTLGYTCE